MNLKILMEGENSFLLHFFFLSPAKQVFLGISWHRSEKTKSKKFEQWVKKISWLTSKFMKTPKIFPQTAPDVGAVFSTSTFLHLLRLSPPRSALSCNWKSSGCPQQPWAFQEEQSFYPFAPVVLEGPVLEFLFLRSQVFSFMYECLIY